MVSIGRVGEIGSVVFQSLDTRQHGPKRRAQIVNQHVDQAFAHFFGFSRFGVLLLGLVPEEFHAHRVAYPKRQVPRIVRLADVVVGAVTCALKAVIPLAQRRHQDHGDVLGPWQLLDAPIHFKTVETGHHDIEEDGAGRRCLEKGQTLFAALGIENSVALALENVAEQPAILR